jgi:dTMP kinase
VDNPDSKNVDGGLLIIFDGIDGVGKTTQIELARQYLAGQGWTVEVKRNLGGTPIGEALREVIKSPLERPGLTNLYISAAIQEALVGAIRQDRTAGKLILMDRGPVSLAAYAVYGDGLDPSAGWPYVERGMRQLQPDLSIIYQADIDTALGQTRQKPGEADYFERQPRDYFERVAEGYRQAARRYPDSVVIDANRSIEAVQSETRRHIEQLLQART